MTPFITLIDGPDCVLVSPDVNDSKMTIIGNPVAQHTATTGNRAKDAREAIKVSRLIRNLSIVTGFIRQS